MKSKPKTKPKPKRRTDTIGPRPRVTSLQIREMTAAALAEIPIVAIPPQQPPEQLFGWPWPRPIRVPFHIHPSRQAVICGAEWKEDGGKAGGHWLYFFRFVEGGEHWRVTEAECVKWQEEKG